jgi:hypothetical protein
MILVYIFLILKSLLGKTLQEIMEEENRELERKIGTFLHEN